MIFGNEVKTMKDYHDLCLKHHVLFFNDVFEKIRNSSLKIMGYAPVIICVHQV